MKYFLIVLISLYHITNGQVRDTTESSGSLTKDSSLVKINKAAAIDSVKKTAVVDTLKPLHQQTLSENSFFITNKQIIKLDYRYTGDLFKPFGFYFTKDFGFIGQPNEVMLYGTGFSGISYLEDGILFNNRLTNSLDLNQIQSENIDSIEIVPSPRGFLYSPYNNAVSVNFISKDFLSRPPYSRIKFYQGPNGEAMVDGLFNAWLYKKFNASFDITNRKTNTSYLNSSFSLWQTRLKLKYLLSDKINIIGNFYYVTSRTGLNGGADIIKIDSTTSNPNTILYDELLAPVVYPDRIEQIKQQFFSIRLLGKFSKSSGTDLTFYYKTDFDGISRGKDSTFFSNTNRNKIYGASLKQNFSEEFFNLTLTGNYEKYDLNYDIVSSNTFPVYNYNSSVYSASAVLSLNLPDKKFIPSAFYKISHNSISFYNRNERGFGFDLTFKPLPNISLYAGYSLYQNNFSNADIKNLEIGGSYSDKDLFIDMRFFSRKDFYPENYGLIQTAGFASIQKDMNGISTAINFSFYRLMIESAAAYYVNPSDQTNYFYNVPRFTFSGGLYYKDILFNSNLDLKTGLVYYHNSQRANSFSGNSANLVASNNRIDFTIEGRIQEAAIVYFVWQNLLNTKYFLVPYYPMPKRSIRFGIAWELFN